MYGSALPKLEDAAKGRLPERAAGLFRLNLLADGLVSVLETPTYAILPPGLLLFRMSSWSMEKFGV